MLSMIDIENYKSIQKLQLKLVGVNVVIGENGCGKSNILEAIALVAAAQSHKLDNEFLSSRGIRVTDPTLMRANFKSVNATNPIKIHVSHKNVPKFQEYDGFYCSIRQG